MYTNALNTNNKNKKLCLFGITATGNSKNFQNALNFIGQNGLSSIYITGKKLEKRSSYHTELFLNLNTKQELEMVSLALTYEILNSCGYDCNKINSI